MPKVIFFMFLASVIFSPKIQADDWWWYCNDLEKSSASFCWEGTGGFSGKDRIVNVQACKLGAGLVKSGVDLREVLQVCKEAFPLDDTQIQKLLNLGVLKKGEVSFLPILRTTCMGSAAAYQAKCKK